MINKGSKIIDHFCEIGTEIKPISLAPAICSVAIRVITFSYLTSPSPLITTCSPGLASNILKLNRLFPQDLEAYL